MRYQRFLLGLVPLALAFASMTASAAMVMQMGLSDLVVNADKVFRGTVLTKEPGTVSAGGSELPTVIYTLRVDDAIMGDFGAKPLVTITVFGNLKKKSAIVDVAGRTRGDINPDIQRFSSFDVSLDLRVGGDYLLFTSAPSSVGLSTTIGLGQGLFRIFSNVNGRDMAANGLGNQYLFDGPISYTDLKGAILSEMAAAPENPAAAEPAAPVEAAPDPRGPRGHSEIEYNSRLESNNNIEIE